MAADASPTKSTASALRAAAIQEALADVEDEGGDQEDGDQPAREERQDLAALVDSGVSG